MEGTSREPVIASTLRTNAAGPLAGVRGAAVLAHA
jgi:hypothetical protein